MGPVPDCADSDPILLILAESRDTDDTEGRGILMQMDQQSTIEKNPWGILDEVSLIQGHTLIDVEQLHLVNARGLAISHRYLEAIVKVCVFRCITLDFLNTHFISI